MKRWMIILIASVVLLGLSWLVPHSLFEIPAAVIAAAAATRLGAIITRPPAVS